ncbi:hypothetical protein [Moorella sp. ACPs]|uniref:hypothetical protein n=1 Tax=Neomoorella carbonis TaxID=3062783 RepID=UPI00324BFF30
MLSRPGIAALGAVDDYAFFIWGLLELYEAAFAPRFLRKAIELNNQMLDLFWDSDGGGLFFYGLDGEQLFARPKEIYDGAVPSGNSVAACNLLMLARLTGDERLAEKGRQIFKAFAGEVVKQTSAYSFLMVALLFATGASREIVVAGKPQARDTQAMIKKINSHYLPNTVVIFHPVGNAGNEIRNLIPYIGEMRPLEGTKATAYVCENFACQAPTMDLDRLEELL